MIKPVVSIAIVFAAVFGLALPVLAAPQGGGRHAGPPGGVAGTAYVGGRPGWGGAVYVGGRPGYVGYPGYPGYHGGAVWRGGYWGPRVGVYYGGPGYWGGWPGYWGAWPGVWGSSYVYPYAAAPIVVNPTPQTQLFVQQAPEAAAPAQATPEVSYWYYCTQPAGYFPYVKDCSQPWLKVVPLAPGEQPTAPRLAP